MVQQKDLTQLKYVIPNIRLPWNMIFFMPLIFSFIFYVNQRENNLYTNHLKIDYDLYNFG